MRLVITVLALVLVAVIGVRLGRTSPQADEVDGSAYARQLSSIDPSVRQSAAETIAKLAAVEQKKLVEGYLLQEKDKRVRLALNWALYRLGKSQLLYEVVRDLDSSRHDQAARYLEHLEGPEPLYIFLKQDNTAFKTRIRVIEVLGQIGDSETLNQLKPIADAAEHQLAKAAQASTKEIQERLSQPQSPTKTRPRVVGTPERP